MRTKKRRKHNRIPAETEERILHLHARGDLNMSEIARALRLNPTTVRNYVKVKRPRSGEDRRC